ncbi:NTPase, partial [Acinetobacter baumannii]|nr:NTPase [Acinetobacter baumannii]
IHIYMNLCQIYSPNPRQLIRIINKFSLLKENLDNRKKLFLFLFLIYSEMRLIETYKEINFIAHFYELHLNFHHIRFRQYALNR